MPGLYKISRPKYPNQQLNPSEIIETEFSIFRGFKLFLQESMKRYIFILLLLQGIFLYGQGEIDDQEKIFYRNERTLAILLNSNGGGLNFRYAKRIDAFRKTLYEAEFNFQKHPKEQKVVNETTNRSFVFGKLNSLYTLKSSIGYQKEHFRKRDLGGISIRSFYNIGPSIAFLKPVYYEYYDISTQKIFSSKFIPHNLDIIGKDTWATGLNETTLIPGVYGKIGCTFEYSRIDAVFHALEAGIGFDAYLNKIRIVDTPPEKILFVLPDDYFVLTLFLSYRFGKVIDTKFNPKRTAVDDMILK